MSRSDSQCWNGTTLRVKFAIACGEGLKKENGEADETMRATARGKASQLESKLPK